MATYSELNAILTDTVSGGQSLREKVRMACLIAAQTIIAGDDTSDPPWATTGHAQRLKWVDKMLASPDSTAREVFGIVVAANAAATQANIIGATDSAIQSNVNESIDALAANLV